jgi:hypothetical protein
LQGTQACVNNARSGYNLNLKKAKRKMLNLSSGGGSGNFIRFSPAANAWTNSNNEEIQLKKVVFDIDNVQTGWLQLGVGVRDWQPDAAVGKKGAQPSPDHKRGFSVKFYNKQLGTCEWSSNGVGPNMGLEAIYVKCIEDRKTIPLNATLLPVIEYKGSKMEKIGKGTTRIPQFDVTDWIARPAGMDESSGGMEEEYAAPAPAPAPAPARAPAAKPVAQAAADDDEMF